MKINLDIKDIETLRDICDALASRANELNCEALENSNDNNLIKRSESLQNLSYKLSEILELEVNKKSSS